MADYVKPDDDALVQVISSDDIQLVLDLRLQITEVQSIVKFFYGEWFRNFLNVNESYCLVSLSLSLSFY